jgi:predicted TIM-barrel fold metal-dependent hydrolase
LSFRAVVRDELAALSTAGIRPFDVHAHTGADIDGTTRTSEEHVRDLEAIDGRSVVFPLCVTAGYAAENRRVVEECRRHPERLVPFARLDPRTSAALDAADALAAGARGFKLHPRSEDFRLDHPGVDAILGIAAEARAPVLIHAGVGVGSYGQTIVELAERHPACPIVLAHAAVSDLVWLWRVAPEYPNLFFDTAWWNPADLLALFALVPPGRILFGSDEPYMDLELVLAVALRCARFAGLSEEAIALVFSDQVETLLAGEAPIDPGPAPDPARVTLSLAESRVATLLAAAGGCMLGGGDPSQMLELARLAVGTDGSAADNGSRPQLAELIEEAASPSADAPWALAMAMTLVVTPGVESGALTG